MTPSLTEVGCRRIGQKRLARFVTQIDKEQDRSAFREGIFVRALGRSLEGNPYPVNSKDGLLWEEGWRFVDAPKAPDARKSESGRLEPVVEVLPKVSTNAVPKQERQARSSSGWLFVPLYLAFFAAFGGFLILMLMNIARLGP